MILFYLKITPLFFAYLFRELTTVRKLWDIIDTKKFNYVPQDHYLDLHIKLHKCILGHFLAIHESRFKNLNTEELKKPNSPTNNPQHKETIGLEETEASTLIQSEVSNAQYMEVSTNNSHSDRIRSIDKSGNVLNEEFKNGENVASMNCDSKNHLGEGLDELVDKSLADKNWVCPLPFHLSSRNFLKEVFCPHLMLDFLLHVLGLFR